MQCRVKTPGLGGYCDEPFKKMSRDTGFSESMTKDGVSAYHPEILMNLKEAYF